MKKIAKTVGFLGDFVCKAPRVKFSPILKETFVQITPAVKQQKIKLELASLSWEPETKISKTIIKVDKACIGYIFVRVSNF